MFRLKASFYESGEKAGKLLARQLKKRETASAIPGIKGSSGKIVTTAKEINQVFVDFYKTLYTSDTVFDWNWKNGFPGSSSLVCCQNKCNSWKLPLERMRLEKPCSQCNQVKLQD